MTKALPWLALAAFGLIACTETPRASESSAPNPEDMAVVLKRELAAGAIAVPGTAEDAKLMGFTKCSVERDGMTCSQEPSHLISGVTPELAWVVLDAKPNMDVNKPVPAHATYPDVRSLPLDALSFSAIQYQFTPTYPYEPECQDADESQRPSYCGRYEDSWEKVAKDYVSAGWLVVPGNGKEGFLRLIGPEALSLQFTFYVETSRADLRALPVKEHAALVSQIRQSAKLRDDGKRLVEQMR